MVPHAKIFTALKIWQMRKASPDGLVEATDDYRNHPETGSHPKTLQNDLRF